LNRNPFHDREEPGRDPAEQPGRAGCGRWGLLWVLILPAIALWLWSTWTTGEQGPLVDYSTFRAHLEAGNLSSVIVTGDQIQGTLREPDILEDPNGQESEYTEFITYVPSFGDDALLSLLQEQDVIIETRPESQGSGWLIALNFLPLLLILGVGLFFVSQLRGAGGGGISSMMNMRKSGAQLYERSKERTTFDDVAGLRGAKAELEEIVRFLKNPGYFQRLGGKVPKGVLLVGPPGTGKTLLARAVAGEANVPFFSITGSNFMEMLVGVGASRVRDLFEEAKKASPSIIFIDELDSIGRRRGAGLGGGHDEREQTLNQLLSEMDGFKANEEVIVMAATNRPDILDPALLRPGRFDRRITADLPTMSDRLEILRIHSRNKPLAKAAKESPNGAVDLERLARATPGFSGADLENLLNEGALLAARRGKEQIEAEDIEDARDKIIMGLERENLCLTDEELEMLAYHEAGHALVAAVVPNADPIHKVTIVPRGRAMGVTQQLPERDKYIYRREYMLDRLAVMMGGRAAEQLAFETSTSGAENDLKQATLLARKMVLDWGMSGKLEHMALGSENEEVFLGQDIAQRRHHSESTARIVDQEVQSILNEAYRRATETLEAHREQLDRIVHALLEAEELAGELVVEIVSGERPVSLEAEEAEECLELA
jgi:cell division protease FtsH